MLLRGRKLNKTQWRRGATMAEMIVVFALIGLLLVCLATVLTASLKVFVRVRSLTDLQSVGEVLMDKVTGEISGAQTGAQEALVLLSDGSNGIAAGGGIALYDRTGSQIYITTASGDTLGQGGRLLIHYYPATVVSGVDLDAVDWTYDDKVYLGCTVGSLQFERSAQRGNVLRVSLTLSKDGVSYATSRTVECYNFSAPEDMAKIQTGPIAR